MERYATSGKLVVSPGYGPPLKQYLLEAASKMEAVAN